MTGYEYADSCIILELYAEASLFDSRPHSSLNHNGVNNKRRVVTRRSAPHSLQENRAVLASKCARSATTFYTVPYKGHIPLF